MLFFLVPAVKDGCFQWAGAARVLRCLLFLVRFLTGAARIARTARWLCGHGFAPRRLFRRSREARAKGAMQ